MSKRLARSILLAIALLFPTESLGQTLDSLRVGTTVRVWSRALGTEAVQGEFIGLRGDTLMLRTARGRRVVEVPRDKLWRLDVPRSRSKKPGSITGFLLGGVVGSAGGWGGSALASLVFKDCAKCVYGPLPSEKERWDEEDRKLARQTAVVGGVLGAVGGAVIGSRYLGHRWQRVPLGSRVGLVFPSLTAPYHAGLTLTF